MEFRLDLREKREEEGKERRREERQSEKESWVGGSVESVLVVTCINTVIYVSKHKHCNTFNLLLMEVCLINAGNSFITETYPVVKGQQFITEAQAH